MRILFITSTRIGDAVLGSGALAYLVDRYPEARFTIACGPLAAPLFADVPRLDRIVVMHKRKRGGHWFDLWRTAAFTPWFMVVDLRASALAWSLLALHRRILSPIKSTEHRVLRFSQVMRADGVLTPRIFAGAETRARAAALLPQAGVALALAPTANWIGKQWPVERFAELARRLTQPGGAFAQAPVLVLGGPGERAAAEPLLAALAGTQTTALFGEVDLLTAYACLERCRLFIGNDSGLMHLSAASGIPTVGLFGPSREEMYAPWGPLGRVVRNARFEDILNEDFDLYANHSYMESITVDAVLGAVTSTLGAAPQPAMAAP